LPKKLLLIFSTAAVAICVFSLITALLHRQEPAAAPVNTDFGTTDNFAFDWDATDVLPPQQPVSSGAGTHAMSDSSVAALQRMAGELKLEPGEIGRRVPVLMYHRIHAFESTMTPKERLYVVTPQTFESQITSLLNAGFHPIRPSDLMRALTFGWSVLPEKPFLLTFDDGFRDQYDNAFPVLKRYDVPATFFVLSNDYRIPIYLSRDQILALDRSGLATIGSHTKHHAYLTFDSKAVRSDEISGSKQELEAVLGHPVTVFAYPFGSWSNAITAEVEDAGYDLAFGVGIGSAHASSSRYQIRRIPVQNNTNLVPLLEKLFSKL